MFASDMDSGALLAMLMKPFGSLQCKPGACTTSCEHCQQSPIYLVQREELLRVVVEAQQEEKAHEERQKLSFSTVKLG